MLEPTSNPSKFAILVIILGNNMNINKTIHAKNQTIAYLIAILPFLKIYSKDKIIANKNNIATSYFHYLIKKLDLRKLRNHNVMLSIK